MKNSIVVFLTIWACFALLSASAQTQQAAKITGYVLDEAKKPVDAATVMLTNAKDSATLKTMLTEPDGSFAFADVKNGDYRMVVTSVGYRNFKGTTFNFSQQVVKLPSITLSATSKALKQVEIAGQKNFVEQKIDRTVVNVNALISNTGSTALEVLEKTPGVTVDDNGNISFKGKSGVMVMIDDKPTYLEGENLANYLKSLPASMLDQIELMTNPPAKYDASGNAGVINIKTKKSKTKGFNGSAAISVGRAAYWRTLESINLNYHVNQVNFFANLGYGIQNNYRRLDVGRTYFDPAGAMASSYTELAYFHPVSYNHNLKTGMDYYLSPKTTLGLVLTGSYTSGHNVNPVNSMIKNSIGDIDSNIVAVNTTENRFYNGGINLNYSHQFETKGQAITFDIDYLKYNSRRDQSFLNSAYNGAGTLGSSQNITDYLPTDVNIYTAKTDYTQPLQGKGKIEAGLKTGYVNTDNAANYFNVINNVATVDYNMTNRFFYKENVNAAYFNFSKEYKRFSLQAGLRLENTNLKGHQLGNAQRPDSAFSQSYTNLFPTAYVLYKLDTAGTNTLKLSYGRRIDRPYYQDLNPFLTILDKYSQFEGNPFLRPQFSSNYSLGYSYKSIFSIAAEYVRITDYQTESDVQKGNVFLATSVNLGESVYYDINTNLTLSPFKWWNFNLYLQLTANRDRGQIYNSYLNTQKIYYNINNSNQFNLANGWSAELTYYYLSPTASAQFTHISRQQINAGIQKKILNNKGSIKLSGRDIFRGNFSAGNITNIPNVAATYHNDFAIRSVTLGFTYNFGSSKDNPKKRDTGGAGAEVDRVRN
ncbi:TonB-dependent receptor [Mucilaginibacter sp. HMF5004]|uniref:TonB-dependent receptor n=1 Tax=Mucilaginibacter rivuli TaxID=2857527 RepID=UPI001C5EC07D|nr:TonB-dependent receptor [Mucilaginibacter rivuli]MBW4888681.1 TonB-dependent receptor [Mucilaginibacter rivuli]